MRASRRRWDGVCSKSVWYNEKEFRSKTVRCESG
jgi:hypothetical protein